MGKIRVQRKGPEPVFAAIRALSRLTLRARHKSVYSVATSERDGQPYIAHNFGARTAEHVFLKKCIAVPFDGITDTAAMHLDIGRFA